MPATCQESDSWTCARVYEWTGNETLAHGATWLIGKPLAILVILLAAVVIRWIASKAIDRVVRRAEATPLPGARHTFNRRAQRAKSLGTLLKSITTTVVFGIAFVMVLSEVGMNVAPILASAGVLGLAIGFGAQNLVKDFLSGVMMMVEDQYGVGDEVDLGEAV
ncbi:MAG: mechanosensitive ion channel family protein, partial [Marmoricola sp.]